jgi:transcriptional regulator with XRE-family HTH domain
LRMEHVGLAFGFLHLCGNCAISIPTVERGTLGQRIRAERERAGVSKRALAHKLNPSNPESARRELYYWESGKYAPERKNREAIAKALGLPSSFFNGDKS